MDFSAHSEPYLAELFQIRSNGMTLEDVDLCEAARLSNQSLIESVRALPFLFPEIEISGDVHTFSVSKPPSLWPIYAAIVLVSIPLPVVLLTKKQPIPL